MNNKQITYSKFSQRYTRKNNNRIQKHGKINIPKTSLTRIVENILKTPLHIYNKKQKKK